MCIHFFNSLGYFTLSENAPLKGHSRGYAIQQEMPHKQTAPSCLSPSELLRPSITTRLLPHFRSCGDSPRGWCKSPNGERIEICPGIALFDCWPIIECTHKQICRHGDPCWDSHSPPAQPAEIGAARLPNVWLRRHVRSAKPRRPHGILARPMAASHFKPKPLHL